MGLNERVGEKANKKRGKGKAGISQHGGHVGTAWERGSGREALGT